MHSVDHAIKTLDATSRSVLYYYAIANGDNRYVQRQEFIRAFRITERDFSGRVNKCVRKGLLVHVGYYSEPYVRHEDRIAILDYMWRHDPDLEPTLRSIFVNNRSALMRLGVIKYAVTGQGSSFGLRLTENVTELLWDHFEAPWLPRIQPMVGEDQYFGFVHRLLGNRMLMDELIDPEVVERMCQAEGHNDLFKLKMQDLRNYYMFVAYGTRPEGKALTTRMPLTTAALGIKKALNADYQGAIDCFNAAFKVLNRERSYKNMFSELWAQYYLVMSYYHLDDEIAQKKLQQFLKKKESKDYANLRISMFPAQVYLDGKKVMYPHEIKSMINCDFAGIKDHTMRLMGLYYDRYYGTGFNNEAIRTPRYALARMEMSAYLELPQPELDSLREMYGPAPALSSMYRKEDWELVIDEIIKTAEQLAPQGADAALVPQQTERVIYVRVYDDMFEIRMQNVLKSGAWSKPKAVHFERLVNTPLECMDQTDRIVCKVMQPNYYDYYRGTPAWKIMPYLVGCDRIFELNSYNNTLQRQITVEQGEPHIKIAKDLTGVYAVTSNITLDMLECMSNGMVTRKIDDCTYQVIPLSETQRRIYRMLLKEPLFPAKAEPQLLKLLTHLEGVVEIKSPLLDKSAVETVEGSGLIVLKVKPVAGMMYDVSILAKPVEQGTVYHLPGTGKHVYYDTADGASFRVKRNLEAETANYHEVLDNIYSPDCPVADGDYGVTLDIEALLQLIDYARLNPERAAIEWAEGKGLSLRAPLNQGKWNVGLKAQNGWFDIEGEVQVDEHKVIKMGELIDIISQQKGRFVRLGENEYIEIDRRLRRQLERIEALAVRNRGHLQVSGFNAALLDESVLDGEFHIDTDEHLAQLQRRISESAELSAEVPANLNATLRPYQAEGYQWMMRLAQWGAGACLADDMGLGKTVQTIAFLLAKAKEGPALIVAPASVVPNWRNEIERFAPTLRVSVLNKADDRAAVISEAGTSDVVVTTYGLLNTEVEALAAKSWTTVCLDEAHTIKNRETKMSQAAMQLQATYRIALTGTPIQNHLGELWNLFRFLNEGLLGPFDTFRKKFVNPIAQEGDKDRRRALQRIIKPFMLRRTKSEVADDLPDKTDIYLPVELTEAETALYEALRQKAVEALEQATTLDVNTLAEITRLRRAACSPSLIDADWAGSNSKIQTFLELVRDFKGDNNRMLVFSQFTSFLDIVRQALDKAGERYLYLDGSTSLKQREQLVEEFQQGGCPLFLISLKAGGLGLNLTGANYVVHLDPWWNPAIEQQATDRAYRIGQMRNVTVYHLLSKGTIEEKIRRLHQTKRDLAESLLEGTDMAGRLTVKDVLELVNS